MNLDYRISFKPFDVEVRIRKEDLLMEGLDPQNPKDIQKYVDEHMTRTEELFYKNPKTFIQTKVVGAGLGMYLALANVDPSADSLIAGILTVSVGYAGQKIGPHLLIPVKKAVETQVDRLDDLVRDAYFSLMGWKH